ncbi:MAG: SDR family oxidoreductase [Elusimicrobia bacterium]|nr:SDR family oxidoreductase [Elusimicrobiota bacterium]
MRDGAVLITGGGSGIGAACAAEFLRRGRNVVVVGRRAGRLKAVKGALALAGDVGDEGFARRAFAAARRRFGSVDVLVNNAAHLVKKSFVDTTAAEWDEVMRTNLRGPFLFSREFLRAAKPGGAIVNIGSLGGIQGTEKFPGLSAYTVSKYGISGLTAALAVEARALGVAVFCAAPGAVDTAMLRKAAPGLKAGAVPADVALVVADLAGSARPDLLSGAVIPLDTNR